MHGGTSPMKRKIAAILAADVAGYRRLVAEAEEETLTRLGGYREVFDDLSAAPAAASSTPPATW